MKKITYYLIIALTFLSMKTEAQVLNPNDPIVEYNESNPPSKPASGTIGKWVRTTRQSWNTDNFKCYYYNGMAFRLRFPDNYDESGNTEYPMIVKLHGRGESGSIYDNEIHLKHSASDHEGHIEDGDFNGFLFYPQNTGGFWGSSYFETIYELLTIHFPNEVAVDRDRIIIHGLSAGGQGVWNYISTYPHSVAAAMPMSAASVNYYDGIINYKYIPVWLSQGGQDTSPSTFTSSALVDTIQKAGGNIRYTIYHDKGHSIWNTHYAEDDFWPFINRAHRTNPSVLTGDLDLYSTSATKDVYEFFTKEEICPGEEIYAKLGISSGFEAYEWRKDGAVIDGANSNEYEATSFGVYDVRFMENGEWNDWSQKAIEVKEKAPTSTPDIVVSGLNSNVIPAPNGATSVPLEMPDGYIEYGWKLEGTTDIISTERVFEVTTPASYVATVTEKFGCSSSFSDPFQVIDANGTNSPPTISSSTGFAKSNTWIQLIWTSNSGSFPASAFEIYRSTTFGSNYELIGISDVTSLNASSFSYDDQDLLSGTAYFYLIRPINETGSSANAEVAVTTTIDTESPTAPSDLRISDTDADNITLSWDASSDDVGVYRYDVFVDGVQSIITEDTEVTIFGLNEKQAYQFYVRARDLTGNISPFSQMIIGVPIDAGLHYKYYEGIWTSLPDFNSINPVKTGNVTNVDLSVSEVDDHFACYFEGNIYIPVAGAYTFETRSDDGSQLFIGAYDEDSLIVDNNGTHGMRYREGTYNFPEPGPYKIVITYFESEGSGGLEVYWKNTAHGVIDRELIPTTAFSDEYELTGVPPMAPSDIIATAISFDSVAVSWIDNSLDETGFQIYRASDLDETFYPIGIVNSGVTSFIDSGLSGSTKYYYQIRALGSYGSSSLRTTLSDELGAIDYGVAAQDGASGNGYLLYSIEDVFERFADNKPNSNNSHHIISIKLIDDEWYFDNNSDYYPLTIEETDVILAEVDFSEDEIVGLEGVSGYVNGIEFGFESGDLEFYADRWDGGSNNGEFTITGTSFIRNSGGKIADITTLATPPAPSAVDDLILEALSISSISLAWSNSEDADYFTVQRSLDNDVFLPIYTIEDTNESLLTYEDTDLSPHTNYYYQIIAGNVGGETTSETASASTLNSDPTDLVEFNDLTIRYESVFDIQIFASDPDGDVLAITGSNLPDFSELTDYGDGSALLRFSPEESDQDGSPYRNITITANDEFGGSISNSFDLVINSNYVPTLTSIEDITLSEGESIDLDIVAEDIEGEENLIWRYDLPSFVKLSTNIDGTGSINVDPDYIHHGTYSASLTIIDQDSGYANTNFDITVLEADPNKTILVNMLHSPANAVDSWNNISSLGMHDLLTDIDEPSGISMELLTSTWKSYGDGDQTGSNTGVFPDNVLQDYYYFGIFGAPDTITMKLSGLDADMKYDLSLVGSSKWSGVSDNGTTMFTIGNDTSSVYVQNNTHNAADFVGISPDILGDVYVKMFKDENTDVGYLNGFSIKSTYGVDEVPAPPHSLSASLSGSSLLLSWIDAPFNELGFYIYRSEDGGESYTKIGEVSENTESYEDPNIEEGISYYYVVTAFNLNGESAYSEATSFIASNTPPVIEIVGDTKVFVNQTSTLSIFITDSPDNTVELEYGQLPAFSNINETTDNTEIVFTPTSEDIGEYTLSFTATDNLGAESTEQISITVQEEKLYTIAVNFSKNYDGASPWNNTDKDPVNGDTYGNLLDENGEETDVALTLMTSFGGIYDETLVTGNDSGIVPDNVLKEYYWWGIYGAPDEVQLKVSGLDFNNKYTFRFISSSTFSGSGIEDNGETNYTIGNKTVSLDVHGNTQNLAEIVDVTANIDGEIFISMTKGNEASAGFINALIIESFVGDPSIFNPGNLTASSLSKTSIGLNWSDNSFDETAFEVYRATSPEDTYIHIYSTEADETSYVDEGLSSGTIFYYKVRARFADGSYSDFTDVVSSGTVAYAVYVNINGIPDYDAAEPWNNLSIAAQTGDIFTGFKNEYGSGVGMTMEVVQGMQGNNDWGASTGDDSGVFPDKVMKSFYFNDRLDPAGVFKLSGLDLRYNYNLKFFGSIVTGYEITTNFSAGGQTVSNYQTDNTEEVVSINSLEVNANGELEFSVQEASSSTWAIFNAFVLEAYPRETSENLFVARSSIEDTETHFEVRFGESLVGISYYPNPSSDHLNVMIENAPASEVVVSISDLMGKTLIQKNAFLNKVNTSINLDNEYSSLESGIYLLSVKIGEKRFISKIIKQ